LYAGISNYNPEKTAEAAAILKQLGTPCLIHQVRYSMFDRTPEAGLLDVLEDKGIGCIAFSPLAQGLLTDRYLNGIPENSRASKAQFLKPEQITTEQIKIIVALNDIAQNRNQTLAQMALAWLLKDNRITSVLIGASSVGQLQNNIDALDNLDFTKAELDNIEAVLASL
jgi:L-glyceraldehyde 3-phosphate reductase